jgi:ABC-type transport system involved in cytochrome bd biosynthesis fused ATPase/permease subunit
MENKINSELSDIEINNYSNNNLSQNDDISIDDCKVQIPIPKGANFDIAVKNINFEVKLGELVCIIGEVGSGKSSLLEAILNSLILLNPKDCDGVHINGEIGYVSQIPWILNETIRNNIILSKSFNEEKYYKILDLCQLNEDLSIFEGKDLTEIGEKGLNLSGG